MCSPYKCLKNQEFFSELKIYKRLQPPATLQGHCARHLSPSRPDWGAAPREQCLETLGQQSAGSVPPASHPSSRATTCTGADWLEAPKKQQMPTLKGREGHSSQTAAVLNTRWTFTPWHSVSEQSRLCHFPGQARLHLANQIHLMALALWSPYLTSCLTQYRLLPGSHSNAR